MDRCLCRITVEQCCRQSEDEPAVVELDRAARRLLGTANDHDDVDDRDAAEDQGP